MIGNSSFKVGIYIRLSRDDGNIESDSIISQRSLLNQYIKENNYSLIDEYVDATVIIGLKQNPTHGRRFSPIFFA